MDQSKCIGTLLLFIFFLSLALFSSHFASFSTSRFLAFSTLTVSNSLSHESINLRLIYALTTNDTNSALSATYFIEATQNINSSYLIHHDVSDPVGSSLLRRFGKNDPNIIIIQETTRKTVLIQLRLIELAFQKFGEKWDFLIFLDGFTFPIKSNKKINEVFFLLKGKNIMNSFKINETTQDVEIRSGSSLMVVVEPKFASWVINEQNRVGMTIRRYCFQRESSEGFLQTMLWNSPLNSTWYSWPMGNRLDQDSSIGVTSYVDFNSAIKSNALFLSTNLKILNLTRNLLDSYRSFPQKQNAKDLILVFGILTHTLDLAKDAFRFINATNGPNVYYVIHDTNETCGPLWREYIQDKPSMRFSQKLLSCWACWELVLLQLKLIEMANDFLNTSWDFLIYASGDTYPLRSNSEIRRALLPLQGRNLIENLDGSGWYRRSNFRSPTDPFLFRKGSQWMILSQPFANYLVNYEDPWLAQVRSLFIDTFAPDEHFIHTIIWNSSWNQTWTPWPIYLHELDQQTRDPVFLAPYLIKWPDMAAHPENLNFSHREGIWNSNALFGRKISELKLVDWINEKRKDENTTSLRHFVK